MTVVGILLAAGAGTRMGVPKALVCDAEGRSWLLAAREAMIDGGCADVVTVLGAQAVQAAQLLGDSRYVVAENWVQGMSASLRAGLQEIGTSEAEAALVHVVDMPDVGADVVRRFVRHARPHALARATYHGAPGHPVLMGREHWEPILAELSGDSGARSYLQRHEVRGIACEDLASGRDVDTSDQLHTVNYAVA